MTMLTYRTAAGRTPASIVIGRELRLPRDLVFDSPEEEEQETDVNVYAGQLRQKLRTIHSEVPEN